MIRDRKFHLERHRLLYMYLDELIADYITQNKADTKNITAAQLLDWAKIQSEAPSGEVHRVLPNARLKSSFLA